MMLCGDALNANSIQDPAMRYRSMRHLLRRADIRSVCSFLQGGKIWAILMSHMEQTSPTAEAVAWLAF